MDWTGEDGAMVALALMALCFGLFAMLEFARPYRKAAQARPARWFTNIALFAIDTLAVRLLLPAAMVGGALLASERGWGLFNAIEAPSWAAFLATIIALDLALYVQHRATHRLPWLWRMHRVHHSDPDFDVTTAARFHPFEILLSMIWKTGVVIALGAPALAVFVFETGFALATLWTHTNLSLPGKVDAALRLLIVTPDMHRIHHSARMPETNSNYGTFLSVWDRLFGTYTTYAKQEQRRMMIGLEEWQDDRTSKLGFSLWLPFMKR